MRPPFFYPNPAQSGKGADVHVTKLAHDPYATNTTARDAQQVSDLFSIAFQQPKGIWGAFELLLEDSCSCGPLLSAIFPLSVGRPLPADVSRAVEFVRSEKDCDVLSFLQSRLNLLHRMSEWAKGTPEYAEWHRTLPPDISGLVSGFNPVLWVAVGRLCDIDVSELCNLFHQGFPILGSFSAPGVFKEKECAPPRSVDDVMGQAPSKWSELPRLFKKESSAEELWRQAVGEVDKGWLSPPIPISNVSTSESLPARRFGVPQKDKVRGVDNLKRSGCNEGASVGTPIMLPQIEDICTISEGLLAPLRCDVALGKDIYFFKGDHADAYKQAPLRPADAPAAVITLSHPDTREIQCFTARTLIFGSTSAVLGYCLISRTVQSLFVRFFQIPLISFFDDFIGACYSPNVCALALECFNALNILLGLKLKKAKEYMGENVQFLGLDISIVDGEIKVSLPDDKRVSYKAIVDDIISSGICPPALAASLAGKLNFGASCVWGRAPRVYLSPIYKQSTGETDEVGVALRHAAHWWSSFLSTSVARTFARPSPHVGAILFSDASLSGLGVVLQVKGKEASYYTCHVPHCIRESIPASSNKIFILELYAALLSIQVARDYCYSNTNIILMVDNNAALTTLLKGHCTRDVLASRIIHQFWHVQSTTTHEVWLERVRSKRNKADAPSRGESKGATVLAFPEIASPF